MKADPATGTEIDERARAAGESFARLAALMHRLRQPGGCPWDIEQTHSSLAIHLLEEAHEALDAIDRDDIEGLEEELGDLLLQVVFHAEIASETSRFDAASVSDKLIDKLIARHPHVFGETEVEGADEVVVRWESLKHDQKKRADLAEGIPASLPALLLAHKIQRRLAGKDRAFEGSVDRIKSQVEVMADEPDEQEIGELLYRVVELAQVSGVDPEGALRRAAKGRLGHRIDK